VPVPDGDTALTDALADGSAPTDSDAVAEAVTLPVAVPVSVAEPLAAVHLEALKSALSQVSGGKSVDVAVKVDPEIVGGIVVRLGSRMVDGSLKTKLNSIRTRMKEVG
jgi:F-type H+-transporting ATPase subunit delta